MKPGWLQRGFTLLELMIALGLMGMLVLLLFGGLRLGSRSWDVSEALLQDVATQGAVSGFLRRSLSQAYPHKFKSAEGERLAFHGEADRMEYVGPIPSRQGIVGYQMVGFFMEEGELRMRWQAPSSEDQDFSKLFDSESTLLLKAIESMTVSYFGAEEHNQAPAWHETWQSDILLPDLVRLRLVMAGGRKWPDLVIPLMLPASANCRWDSFTKRCLDMPAESSGTNTPTSSAPPRT